ncbi:hypothetical protein [Pseudanabaena sp. BC1403]|uniref:hypothetical protein n=1 Tax=Pseudanabaena sp. BC1403 TaxID=2043171 RepID=UPI000CD9E7B1|nr:hypothetical protein [Pseudanabaena sp. BC1403]
MSFSKAFERVGIQSSKSKASTKLEINPEEVPMMYRAQVSGRCSLQFAGNNQDLEDWRKEWVDPKLDNDPQPRYQRKEPKLGLDGSIYRIKIEFPFRLSSNCGQDSILRPIMGKNGIPYLSGSSVKGLFRRACKDSPNKLRLYCGDDDNLTPSTLGFRFHGAYPIGDWSGMRKVRVRKRGEMIMETRYRMLDVIHPQQLRQVGEKDSSPNAFAMVSLFQPTMVFEFSSADPKNTNWQEVENIFLQAIQLGVGGKTSTGYGLGGHLVDRPSEIPKYPITVAFKGRGVSPTLRSDEPEFRPNLFKATLRGHVKRLLAGVTQAGKDIEDRLFGSSSDPSQLQIFWQETAIKYDEIKKPATFSTEGILHIDIKRQESDDIKKQLEFDAQRESDLRFIEQVLMFAFVMGGFGKSWRRVSHEIFYKDYVSKKFEIGCHWELASTDLKWLAIKSIDDLKQFIEGLYTVCRDRFSSQSSSCQTWREAWNPNCVTVYASITRESNVVRLFHDEIFKKTPAIGGRTIVKKFNRKTQEEEDKEQLGFSNVWHRMLPIGNNQYLEIVTVFHSDRSKWKHRDEGDQLKPFLDAIAAKGMKYVWGNQNPLQNSSKSLPSIPTPSKTQLPLSNKPILKPKPPIQ